MTFLIEFVNFYNNIANMDQLKEYKKITKIKCIHISDSKNPIYTMEVKFEQLKPHSIFKFQVTKSKQQLSRLYQRLSDEIFDFDNPFDTKVLANMIRPHVDHLDEINQSLSQCTERIDILTHKHFILFFSINIHFSDFIGCLRQQQLIIKGQDADKNDKQSIVKYQSLYCTDLPSKIKSRPLKVNNQSMNNQQKKIAKPSQNYRQTDFESMISLLYHQEKSQLQVRQASIIDFTHIKYYDSELLFTLQQCKKITKVKNFFKNWLNQAQEASGYISIHKRQGKLFKKIYTTELQAEPKSMKYNLKTNMIMVLTTVGVYVYLSKMEKKLQQMQLFAFVQLIGVVDFATSSHLGQIYLLRSQNPGQLHVYGLNKESLMKTQYKFRNPSSICYQQDHNRLFISDEEGVHIYFVNEFLDIKRLHCVKADQIYINIVWNHGYLYCISKLGFMTVIEIKPPQKQKLMSITTNIDLPPQTSNVVGCSKNMKLIISNFKNCIVLIDTFEGPIYTFKQTSTITLFLHFDKQSNRLLALSDDGQLNTYRLSQKIL